MAKERLYCSFSYNIHDSSVAFSLENRVILVLEAERIFKEKRKRCNKKEMEYLIEYGLHYLGKQADDVDCWAMTTLQNPLLWDKSISIFDEKTKRPKNPYWDKFDILGKERSVYIINHHLAHAASYLLSDFDDAIIITCDGGGDFNEKNGNQECGAVFSALGNKIERLYKELNNPINGRFYGSCSTFLYNALHNEGKMMALAAFGQSQKAMLAKLKSVKIQLNTLGYSEGTALLQKSFPEIKTGPVNLFNTNELNFSASVQSFFTNERIKDISNLFKKLQIKPRNLVMAGGTNLNLDTNTEILKSFPDIKQFIAPCCDDTGQSLGALSILIVEETGLRPQIQLPYIGMGVKDIFYSKETILATVDILNKNGVVILHNSKAEIGPRALGNRSLIGRADNLNVKRKISEEIKQRESYRPVAPVTIEEKVNEYFIGPKSSLFMLYKYDVVKSKKNKIKGAVHYDGSARVQTITKESNSFLYDLINYYGNKTGTYVLLNTSLNLKGDPIANTLDDSLKIYEKINGAKILIYNGKIERLDA